MIKKVEDQIGRIVEYEFPPQRIISLCPGVTDTLYSLKLDREIVGRTRYCIYPTEKVENANIVGGTKEIKLEAIHQLKPDLIIAEKEENTREVVEQLESYYPVYVAEVQSVKGAYKMIEELGQLTDRQTEAEILINTIKSAFQTLPNLKGKRAAYVIWKKPYMVVGKDTYINSLLEEMGCTNPFVSVEGRYPTVNVEEFQNSELDYLFLASEPYPFKEKHKDEFLEVAPNVKVIIVDGEMFWYGSRMIKAAKYLGELFSGL